jgi:hypothetical protein
MEKTHFPMDNGWVQTPKLRKRLSSPEKKYSSVPSSPILRHSNHFGLLSPPLPPSSIESPNNKKKRKRKKTTPHSRNSPLSHEITDQWDQQQQEQNQHVPSLETPTSSTAAAAAAASFSTATGSASSSRQMSFIDYLKDELTVTDFDSAQELKRERVTNFLGVPAAIEKVINE